MHASAATSRAHEQRRPCYAHVLKAASDPHGTWAQCTHNARWARWAWPQKYLWRRRAGRFQGPAGRRQRSTWTSGTQRWCRSTITPSRPESATTPTSGYAARRMMGRTGFGGSAPLRSSGLAASTTTVRPTHIHELRDASCTSCTLKLRRRQSFHLATETWPCSLPAAPSPVMLHVSRRSNLTPCSPSAQRYICSFGPR